MQSPTPHSVTIQLSHCDAAGVIFYPRIAELAHDHYEAALEAAGYSLAECIRGGQIALPIVHASIDCQAPLRHGDRAEISCHCSHCSERSYHMTIRISVDGRTCASVSQVHCAVDVRSGTPCPLPDELRALLKKL